MTALAVMSAATLLRLSASRQPYIRGGIPIGARGVFTTLTRDEVDVEQALALFADPVVQIAFSSDEGKTWVSPTPEEREAAIKELREAVDQRSLSAPVVPSLDSLFAATGTDSIAELGVRVVALLRIEAAFHAQQELLEAQGFQSLPSLLDAWSKGQGELTALKMAAEQNSTADRQGSAPAGDAPPTAGGGEGQGAAGGDQSAAPADQAEKPVSAAKAKPAKKTSTKPAGE